MSIGRITSEAELENFMRERLQLPGNFIQGLQRAIADATVPSGNVEWTARSSAPAGYLLCDGDSLLRDDYPTLFDAIGTTYGAVDGSHFSVPDLRGRVPVGAGTGSGLTARALADEVGEEEHSLSVDELAGHTHVGSLGSHFVYLDAGGEIAAVDGSVSGTGESVVTLNSPDVNLFNLAATDTAGGDDPHNNMQPSLALNAIIKT